MIVERWRANKELIRKHYVVGEDGTGGACGKSVQRTWTTTLAAR
jgi:hypothetical protein